MNLYVSNLALADRELREQNPSLALELLNACPPARWHWEWDYLYDNTQAYASRTPGHSAPISCVAFSLTANT